ncbi:hypothetical protein [Legionella jamestowniensis]|uniref:Uncharacterized protein n=1 Tax=Legionella jamestowniensis TaxID=455 RepID=A0A0W0ULL1_9GAMM|nr:hypothetical protein [Legionella jamestowniensis]KTD08493.1 hypothetical protein Ljam_2688 [Legionella jamestowniensis]OCH97043.1 hypothetical protein A8135_05260 [Legionella jamestowniensis]SFL51922.1 hypothetical protein SAMN02746073_0632 [Legionella jamestowniensis DSM 19215]
MKRLHCYHLLFLFAFSLFPLKGFSVTYVVHPEYPISEISEWTEQTLMVTLTAGFHDDASEAANVRRHYLPAAWTPMEAFLRDKVHRINEQHLTLNPQPVVPSIVTVQDCEGTSCWRVHQAFLIPELRNRVDFNALVVTADPAHGSPLLIQRLDIVLSDY